MSKPDPKCPQCSSLEWIPGGSCYECGWEGSAAEAYDLVFGQLRQAEDQLRERDAEIARLRKVEWGVAHNAHRRFSRKVPRWARVSEITSHGSTISAEICKRHGVDPHEIVG